MKKITSLRKRQVRKKQLDIGNCYRCKSCKECAHVKLKEQTIMLLINILLENGCTINFKGGKTDGE